MKSRGLMKVNSMKDRMLKRFNHENKSDDKQLIPALPGSLNIELTSACNHNCFFCPYHSNFLDKKVEPKFMDGNLVKRLLLEAWQVGIGHSEVGFHMTGEPLLCKEFSEYVRYAKELGFKYVFTTTNGVLSTPSKIVEYINAGLDSIRFSVNGATAESYKATHGSDDFDLVLDNIKFLNNYRKTKGANIRVSLSTVFTKQSMGEIPLIKEIFKDLVDEMVFFPALNLDRFLPELDNDHSLPNENDKFEYTPCATAFNSMYISCEGLIVPCCAAVRSIDLVMSDLKENITLIEAWQGEKFIRLRQDFLQGRLPSEFCKDCYAINKNSNMVL